MADSEQQHKKRSRLCVTQSTNAVKGMVDVSDSADEGRIVCLYYKYVPVADVDAAIKDHEALCKRLGLDGRVRIASEGINGTLTGSAESIVEYEKQLRLSFGDDIDFKTSSASVGVSRDSRICRSDGGGPFFEKHLAVRKVTQICSLGRDYDLSKGGRHLSPAEFHDLIHSLPEQANIESESSQLQTSALSAATDAEVNASADVEEAAPSDVVLIDCRNTYESDIGHFRGAIRPDTRNFAEFPRWVQANKALLKGRKVAMYCTGGIRCESASAFLREEASPTEVFQLRGGIHRYLQEFPTGGLYRGKNFVFDSRVAVGPREHCIDNKTKQDSKREGRPIVAGGSNGEDVVGRCTECQRPHDAYDHNRGRCHRCRALVLVCPNCLDAAENESNLGAQSQAKGSNESTRQAQQTDQNEVSHAKNPLSNIGKDERPLIFCRRHGSWSRLVKQALANVGSEVDSFKQKLEMLEKQVSALTGRKLKSQRKTLRGRIQYCLELRKRIHSVVAHHRQQKKNLAGPGPSQHSK
eukprot:INCI12584.3.p1 GENE.INCI12584.3~~INCI12584.3.p1  ORF type:complete len:548 (-),score=90.91 INCI12584.3:32-1606(-)